MTGSYEKMTTKDELGIKSAKLLEQAMPNGITRMLSASSAFDLRKHPQNYGIHCMDLFWEVKRGNVAVTWRLFSGWWLEQNREGKYKVPDGLGSVDYHSPVPLYAGQYKRENCEHTGGDCYADGSGLESHALFNRFIQGPEEVWRTLEEWLVDTERRIEAEKANARADS